jgi:hypothetical protein
MVSDGAPRLNMAGAVGDEFVPFPWLADAAVAASASSPLSTRRRVGRREPDRIAPCLAERSGLCQEHAAKGQVSSAEALLHGHHVAVHRWMFFRCSRAFPRPTVM